MARTGGLDRASFTFSKAWSWSGVHTKVLLGLINGRRGAAAPEMLGEKSASWFTKPMNDRRSVRLAGLAKSVMARTFSGSAAMPSLESW